MKLIFYFFSICSLKTAFFFCDLLFKLIPNFLLKTLAPFKTTKKNIEIAFPSLTDIETFNLSKESYKETIKSFYETLFVWSRNEAKIIEETKRINNRFLFSSLENSKGLIMFAVHNRSIDFLLRWMSSQRQHTSLYKVIKFKNINKFVKNFRGGWKYNG